MKIQTARNLHSTFSITIAIAIGFALGCGGGGSGERYLGDWQSDKYGMTISKDGELFVVEVRITSGWQGLQGKHTAKLEDASLKFNTPLFGEATLSSDGTKIYWAGDEWLKQQQ